MEMSKRQTDDHSQAEEFVRKKEKPRQPPGSSCPKDLGRKDLLRLIQELQTKQVKLHRQNQKLRSTLEHLRKTQARYVDLYDSAPVGYVTLDTEGVVLGANLTLAAELGVDRDSLLGNQPYLLYVADDDRDTLEAHLQAVFESEERQECELRLRRKDGSYFEVHMQSIAVDDHLEGPVCHAAVFDISKRKEAENIVRAQRNLLKTVFSEIPGLHSLKDRNFAYQYVNPAFRHFLGREEEEIIGKTDFDILPLRKARRYRKEDTEVMETGRPLVVDEDASTPLFGEKWFQITKIPVKDEEGRIAGIISSITDITAHKKMEDELLKVQKLKSVGVLAGGIAHDFNNLLTSILGNVELAKMYIPPENKAYRRLVQAENASLAAKNLTRQLLTFSKGGAPVTKTASVPELIRDSTEFTIRGSNVRAIFYLPEDLWLAEIDEGQISQVIQNLVKNADQAMPDGGTIEIRAQNVKVTKRNKLPLASGPYIKISVGDEGPGIPDKHLVKIFEPYYTTKQQGSGLGLAVCYSILKQHRGYLAVESKPERGTTFHFYLPAIKTAAQKPETRRAVFKGEGRVLVMDDDQTVKEVAGDMLRHIGYEVEFALDGLEAIKRYIKARRSGRPFAAVLLDLTIRGGMGGREAAQKLLELDPDAKVIVSSGYATDPIMTEYGNHGFSGAVHKPYKVQELSAALHAAIETS